MGAAIALPTGLGRVNLGELLRVVGLPSERERATKRLDGSAGEIVRIVLSIINDLVLRTIEQRTAEEFSKTRMEVFPQYFAAMRALGDLVRIVVPPHARERLMVESLCELEADFRDLGPSSFGSDLSDRGMFTVWTLRKIKDLAQEIGNLAPATDKEADADIAMKFATYAIWTRFHVDCLIKSMRAQMPIYPGVVAPIVDGLRAAVDAYAWIRQAIDLRIASPEPELNAIPWDEEDELLLADSMRTLR